MAGLEDALSQILGNPESMAKIMSLAQSFAAPPAQPAEPESEEPAPTSLPASLPVEDLQRVLQTYSQSDAREAAFLHALAPFLRPSRREKIDKVLEIARLSHLAGYALRTFSGSEERHV